MLFRSNRSIFVKSNISCKIVCKSLNNSEIEYLFIELFSGDSKILIGSVYRPNRSIDISPFIDLLQRVSVMYNNVVVAGDFNSNLFVDNNLSSEMFSLGLFSCNNSVPTNFSNSCNTLLDLFFVEGGTFIS